MKWSLHQLERITTLPYKFSFSPDYSELAKKVSDIYDIKNVVVTGVISRLTEGRYRIIYHVSGLLVLQCALTLDPIDYLIEKDYDEVFSIEDNSEYYLIENNTIDLNMAVWSNILIEKPLVVTKPDAYEILRERGVPIIDDLDEE